jgi:hypothetical protein
MKRIVWVAALIALPAVAPAASASDPIGGFVVVDQVMFEPSASAPQRVQVWGTFSLAQDARGRSYSAPRRGYLYFAAVQGKEADCLKEWRDFEKAAGKAEVIGFGRSPSIGEFGKVHVPGTDPPRPVPYPLNFGLVKIRPDTTWAPVRGLSTFPRLEKPSEGEKVAPGRVNLVAANLAARKAKVKYVFELKQGSTVVEASDPIDPGETKTEWSPKTAVQAGKSYTWSVRAVTRGWKGPIAKGAFQGKGE